MESSRSKNGRVRCRYERFILAIMRGDRSHALESLHTDGWEWEELLRQGTEQAVLPALSELIDDLEIQEALPQEISEFLATVEELNAERNTALVCEVELIASLLNQAGIIPTLLKGVAYLHSGVYSKLGRRYMTDIDLLVSPSQLPLAVRILTKHRFERADEDAFGLFRHHYPPLKRENSFAVELHTRLGRGACETILPSSEVLERATLTTLRSTRIGVPCPEHLITHLIMHTQLQHSYHERVWPPIRAMYDLLLTYRQFGARIDWRALEGRFRKGNRLNVLLLHLKQVNHLLDAGLPVPDKLRGSAQWGWMRRQFLRQHPGYRHADPIYLFSESLAARLQILRHAVTTSHGRRVVMQELLKPGMYERVFTSLATPPGPVR